MLRERFTAAAENEPLNDLAAADRRELDALLERVSRFEDLPGRWQAALLSAEVAQPSSGHRPCCAKYSRAASSDSRSLSPFAP
jgi:hypothetical protein